MYEYTAIMNHVVDGDTINLTIDLGFRMTMTANCRLAGINAPEMRSSTGEQSKEYLIGLMNEKTPLKIISKKLDKYGRPVVEIIKGNKNINQIMLINGMAAEYKD